MSRKPIQVPEELKTKVEELKGQFRARTEYEVIEKLIAYYEKNPFHLLLEESVRNDFKNAKTELRIREDSDFVKLLLHHWKKSENVSKDTLSLLLTMGNRW